jgi:cytochrome P450
LWDRDPNVFAPETWIKSPTGGARERLAFLGFGAGPRTCLGERFARAELAFLVAAIVGRYEIKFKGTGPMGKEQEVKLELGLVMRIGGGLRVKLTSLPEC